MTCYNCINGIPGPQIDRNGGEIPREEEEREQKPRNFLAISLFVGLMLALAGIGILLS